MTDSLEVQLNLSETKEKDNNLKIDTILYLDNNLIQLITKAQEQGLNCLDFSKTNINEFPSQLLEFTTLQYLYLEGNQLIQLPDDLFLRLTNLKWLDLRNNQLTSIPNHGLAKHSSLQYLLLSGNHLRTLPFELGKVKTLSALNLDGNPLDWPLIQIIKQGIKAIQQYLRDKLDCDLESSSLSLDNDQQQTPKRSPRKSKLETDYDETSLLNLSPLRVQSCRQYARTNYSPRPVSSSVRLRPESGPQVKVKTIPKKNNELQTDVYTVQEQALTHLKHHDIKADAEIQQLRSKSFIKSKDYKKPIVHTPFYSNRHSIQMTSHSSESIVKEDEIRRIYDRQIHARIRQITDKMLKRRLEARGSIFEERRQVKLEVQEVRRLISEGTQHRPIQINTRFKTFNGPIKSHKKL